MNSKGGKTCVRCGEWRPLADYRRHNRSADGLGKMCRLCRARAKWEREQRTSGGSLPPFEQWLKNRYVRLAGAMPARRNLTTRQIERLFDRGIISQPQLAAGLRYRKCWELSGMPPKLTADYGDRIGVGETTYGMPATEAQAMWRARLREANAELGAFYQRVAERVCVEEVALLDLARSCGVGGGKTAAIQYATRVLSEALDILRDHWRIGRAGQPGHPSARGGCWRADGAEVGVDPSCWESVADGGLEERELSEYESDKR